MLEFGKQMIRAIPYSRLSHVVRLSLKRGMATFLRPWRFAPLARDDDGNARQTRLQGIVFDVDGTLCQPQNYMFREMREVLGIPKSVDILEKIQSLPDSERELAQEKIRDIERSAMKVQRPQPGLAELMDYLDQKGIQKAICTRNFDEPISHLLRTFIPSSRFSPIVTRAFHPPKPDPAGILHISGSWGIDAVHRAHGLIMVGDSVDDMVAGSKAGAVTVLLVNKDNEHLTTHENTDVCISRLDDLIGILERGQ